MWIVGIWMMSRYWVDGLMSSRYPSLSCLRIELSELQHSPRAAQGSAFSRCPLSIRYRFHYEASFRDWSLPSATSAALYCRNRPDSSINLEYRSSLSESGVIKGWNSSGGRSCFELRRKVEKVILKFCQQLARIFIVSPVSDNP